MTEPDKPQDSATGESEEPPEISAEFEAELARCRRPLRDFGTVSGSHSGFARSDLEAAKITIPADRLPVIASLHLVMRLLIGTRELGRAEKLAWEYVFTFRGRSCSLSQEKFGLRLYLQPQDGADAQADAGEIVSKLAAAGRMLEKNLLPSLVETQVSENRVLVHNQVGSLRGIYQYFRRLAEIAYSGDGILAKQFDEQHNEPFPTWLCLAGLKDVDGLCELPGFPGAAA
jgi:hypothetical protein